MNHRIYAKQTIKCVVALVWIVFIISYAFNFITSAKNTRIKLIKRPLMSNISIFFATWIEEISHPSAPPYFRSSLPSAG